MKKIVVKKIDTLTSKTFKNKHIYEYLIYISFDDTLISAYTVFGNEAKEVMLEKLFNENFDDVSIKNNVIIEL